LRIAKCYVKPTIEQKEIDKELHFQKVFGKYFKEF
jgi:hypothetical protein